MKKRHIVLLFLTALAVIVFVDRIVIAAAGARIQEDLHIPPQRWGWILGAFILSYGCFGVPIAAMSNRRGPRRVLTGIVLWWSAFTALTGAARGFYQLFATRFLFGVGEAGAYPVMSAVIARWFPARERARTQGFMWAASRLGGALAPLIYVPLEWAVGWRWTFACYGAFGIVWAVAWRIWYRDDPAEKLGPDEAELAEIAAGAALTRPARVPWARLLSRPQLVLIFVMYFCYAWGSWFFFGWFPVYLVKDAGFTHGQMGVFSALPFLLGAIANIAGGLLGDRLASSFGLRTGRRLIGCGSLAIAALLLMGLALARDRTAIVVFSSLAFGISDMMLPIAWAVCLDIGREHAGVVSGVMNTAGQLGGAMCSILFGYIVAATGNYHTPIWIIAAMVLLAAILFTRIDPTRRLVPEC